METKHCIADLLTLNTISKPSFVCQGNKCNFIYMYFQENEQRRLQEEKAERRRKAQAEISKKVKGWLKFIPLKRFLHLLLIGTNNILE